MNENLILVLLVIAGGSIGALLRFGISMAMPNTGGITWGILLVNLIGCTLITMIFFSFDLSNQMRVFVFVGIFGAFTTMSSVSLDTLSLFSDGKEMLALSNFALNMTVCVGGGFLGKFASSALTSIL